MMSGNVCLVVQSCHLSKFIPLEIRNGFLLLTSFSNLINFLFYRSPIGGSFMSDIHPSPSQSIEGPNDMSYIHC